MPFLLSNTTKLNLIEDSTPFDITLSNLASTSSNWIKKHLSFSILFEPIKEVAFFPIQKIVDEDVAN
jgi:hypothetical protein